MFTSAILTTLAALLCSSLGLVDARTVPRDVVDPPITYPTTGTVWNVGDRHNVTWDTSVIPSGFTSNGMIVLGYLDDADGDDEHLDLNNPLAQGFPITAGRAEITVPAVSTRNTYILVLFGDSGNASGKFTIKNISIGTPPSSSATSTAASSAASSPPASATSDASSSPSKAATSATTLNVATTPSQTKTASASGTAASSIVSAVSSPSVASSAFPTTQASPAAQSAGSTVTSPNAGMRAASFGGALTWLSTMCSLTVALGFAL